MTEPTPATTMHGQVEHKVNKTPAMNVHLESIIFTVQFGNLLSGILKNVVLLQIFWKTDNNLFPRHTHISEKFLNIKNLFSI